MKSINNASIEEVMQNFPFEGIWVGAVPYGHGHINDTYAVYTQLEDGQCRRYILQRINQNIFKDVNGLMSNIVGVTDFLNGKIKAAGGNPWRETLNVLRTKDNKNYYTDIDGGAWRLFPFIEGTVSLQLISRPEDFYESALAFGNFQRLLADYPAATLSETIPDFHNTGKRFLDFQAVVDKDPLGLVQTVREEIAFVQARAEETGVLTDLLAKGQLPLRVTHNDTKLNNVLFDQITGKGICVIDLDTVMPGLCHYDFGDAIRFGASSAAEDETNLQLVTMRLDLFSIFTKGYLEALGDVLTPAEKAYLPMGAKLMTLECGMRFLADYLAGDTYFKIQRPGHNLDRARNQFKLVADMEDKFDAMTAIVKEYA